MKTRRRFTKQFKNEVVESVLKGEKTTKQIAKELNVHYTLIEIWKALYLSKQSKQALTKREQPPQVKERRKDAWMINEMKIKMAELLMENDRLKQVYHVSQSGINHGDTRIV